jgi:hypothetical protein
MALESGRALLDEQRRRQAEWVGTDQTGRADSPPTEGAWRRLRRVLLADVQSEVPDQSVHHLRAAFGEQMAALEAWLLGLELVQERFLKLLEVEDIHAIEALGEVFDPRLHLAVQAEAQAGTAPGTVIRVMRKGYRQRDRMLRYAEVVVSRAPKPAGDSSNPEPRPFVDDQSVFDGEGGLP